MFKTITIFFFIVMFISGYGQARKASDGLYYDQKGKIFTGTSIEYYTDSLIRASIEIKDGMLDGQTRIYFENGQLEEIRSFKKGMMHGKWEKWNLQNIKVAEANYMDDKKDGKWFVWDDNGTLRYNMTYREGEKTGNWLMYDEQGKLINRKDF